MFDHRQLVLARRRRKVSAKLLAEKVGLSAVHLSRIENGLNEPTEKTVQALAQELGFPPGFFFRQREHELQDDAVSFRSLRSTSVREREAAKAAGEIGVAVAGWLDREFRLPAPDLPDLGYERVPEAASRSLRQFWRLGEKPVSGMIALLEAKGVRVFSLAEETHNVDAFSFWCDGIPFVFLNTMKTPEHSIMDAAHELGHLVLHRAGDNLRSRDVEKEANAFASSFLMPEEDVRGRLPKNPSVRTILAVKTRWRVSAMALAYRAHSLGLLTEWQYRSACIELTQRGFRTGEPGGLERETSKVWQQVLTQLWKEKRTKQHIASSLDLPLDEVEKLTFGLTPISERPSSPAGLKLAE